MINKILILITFVFVQQLTIAQAKETCESPVEDPLLELNSITKCSIEENVDKSNKSTSRNSKQIGIQVSSRKRVVRNRDAVSGISKTGASHKIASLKQKASLVGSLDLTNENVLENVPFNLVQEIPLFKSCEKAAISEHEKCFKEEISNHIRKNFSYPEDAYESNVQGRVYVQFIIDKLGTVSDLRIRGPYKGDLLEKEAKRIIEKLPKFKPGKHNGREVKVKYGLPINFKIPGKRPSNIKKNKIAPVSSVTSNLNVINFVAVDEIPTFKVCSMYNDNSDNCFKRELIKHVNKNFDYPQDAITERIQGKIITSFVVDKTGKIINIKTKSPDGCGNCGILELATKQLFEKLPVLIPGRQNGKAVNVKHSFPLDFKLD